MMSGERLPGLLSPETRRILSPRSMAEVQAGRLNGDSAIRVIVFVMVW